MKFLGCLITLVLFCFSVHAMAVPVAPTLTYSIDGTMVTVSWNAVPGATQYKLSYAPAPYTGPQSIGTVDVGTQTSFSADLWEGAAFYVAVQAGDDQGFSGYSNIENFTITPTASINLAGNWTLTETIGFNLCSSVPRKPISGIAAISQLNDTVTIKFHGGSATGDINEDELALLGNISEDGGGTTIIVIDFFTVSAGSSSLTGNLAWTWENGTSNCSGSSTISLSR